MSTFTQPSLLSPLPTLTLTPGNYRTSESDANDDAIDAVTTKTSQSVTLPSTPSTKRRRKGTADRNNCRKCFTVHGS